MKVYSPNKWKFRKNRKRKNKDTPYHPSIIVGEKDNKYANIGLTHNAKRGHHKNIPLHENPNKKDKRKSYLRTDLRFDDKEYLKEKLYGYKLSTKDIDKIYSIINKKR